MISTITAKQIFNDILQHIETSELNYFVSKTPYSATISLKCSLVKKYKAYNDATQSRECRAVLGKKIKSEHHVVEPKEDFVKLKSTIECLEKNVSGQKNVIHEKSKQSKELAKSAEDQVEELLEELLIVKRERVI